MSAQSKVETVEQMAMARTRQHKRDKRQKHSFASQRRHQSCPCYHFLRLRKADGKGSKKSCSNPEAWPPGLRETIVRRQKAKCGKKSTKSAWSVLAKGRKQSWQIRPPARPLWQDGQASKQTAALFGVLSIFCPKRHSLAPCSMSSSCAKYLESVQGFGKTRFAMPTQGHPAFAFAKATGWRVS